MFLEARQTTDHPNACVQLRRVTELGTSTLATAKAQAQSSCITNDAKCKDCIILPHEVWSFPI